MARRAASSDVDVSVIIVNYNVREYLANALESLRPALRGIRSEVIVVDNASTDGSVAMLRRSFPRVHLIASPENLGFARANNLALRKARGRHLLLLNPDTVVQEDTVRVMLAYLEAHPDVGLAGCKILNPDGTFQLAARRSIPTPWIAATRILGLSRLFPGSTVFGRYNLTYRSTEETYDVDAVSGSFMFVRRDVVEGVGGLDERFFMYGEDLDWCYRIGQAGWRVRYVHSTSIIHYKGESTRRSSLDELDTFYHAMRLFVEKHFTSRRLLLVLLTLSIRVASVAASVGSTLVRMWMAAVDALWVVASLLLAEFLWRGGVLLYPSYAYPAVFLVPSALVVGALYGAGVYTVRSLSVTRSLSGVLAAYLLLAALTAFFKEFAFSRMIVVISGAICALGVPGWRLLVRVAGRSRSGGRPSIFGRRTAVIGSGPAGQAIASKLRTRMTDGFDVAGFVAVEGATYGGLVIDLPVLGPVASLRKIVQEHRLTDLVVAPGTMSNRELLALISEHARLPVAFHIVPGTLEVLIGKASVESLQEVPLVEVAYNIQRTGNRAAKRLFDIVCGLLLITLYPFVYLIRLGRRPGFSIGQLASVLAGRWSLVGPPESPDGSAYVGKPGLTGLIQLQGKRPLLPEEREHYLLSYARNQSVLLDLEILLKTLVQRRRVAA
ncbi:MAG: glycosyltransferase [Bacteroidota bacterium]|mgnify:CR=1 FL=1